MGADASLFRQGLISGDKWNKLGVQKGAIQKSRMADFDDRSGTRDQGGIRDRGDVAGGNRHIDTKQDKGSPARASGAPSRGGQVAGGERQPTRRTHIDDGRLQKPDFPTGGKGPPNAQPSRPNVKASSAVGRGGKTAPKLKRVASAIPAQGGQYGGGGRDTQ